MDDYVFDWVEAITIAQVLRDQGHFPMVDAGFYRGNWWYAVADSDLIEYTYVLSRDEGLAIFRSYKKGLHAMGKVTRVTVIWERR